MEAQNINPIAEALKKKEEEKLTAKTGLGTQQINQILSASQPFTPNFGMVNGTSVKLNIEFVAKQIKTLRNNAGMTQRSLAKIAHVSQGTIARAEKGNAEVSFYTFCKIATALGKIITLT